MEEKINENNFIQRFKVEGLFGYKNLDINFKDRILILIGENGYGKTTILNMLYYVISFDYESLANIKFNKILIKINNVSYEFSRELLKDYCRYLQENKSEGSHSLDKMLKRILSESIYNELLSLVSQGNKNDFRTKWKKNDEIQDIPYEVVYSNFLTIANNIKTYKIFYELTDVLKSYQYNMLYYPTYRRIERDLHPVFNKINDDMSFLGNSSHLIKQFEDMSTMKFGMADVESQINDVMQEVRDAALQGFSTVSGEMLKILINPKKAHDLTSDSSIDIDKIKIILARIGDDRLSQEDKENIISISNKKMQDSQYIYLSYFLEQLQDVYKNQECYDNAIKKFCKVCNKYLDDKEFVYDENNVKLNLYRRGGNLTVESEDDKVNLNQLSSGEKQIISIFSQVYLEIGRKSIVLFDEPELSLSIFWQKMLLKDIMDSGNCEFLLAVTHSPFIFKNEMQKYTIGMNEFLMSHED